MRCFHHPGPTRLALSLCTSFRNSGDGSQFTPSLATPRSAASRVRADHPSIPQQNTPHIRPILHLPEQLSRQRHTPLLALTF